MKPILYKADETEFVTNGLGRLSDAISCKVTEERNGPYELEMVYPNDGVHFDDIKYSRIIMAKPADSKDPQPFRIYEIERPLNGHVTIRAEHISYQMSDIPVSPFTSNGVLSALTDLNKNAAESSPFTFWTDKNTSGTFTVDTPTSMRSLLGGQEGSIIDVFGGEWEFDRYTAKLWNERGKDNGVTIRYGKNLTDIKQEESIAETYTGIYPYWKTTDGIVTLDEKILYSDNADKYPYHKTKVVDFSSEFDYIPTQDELRDVAKKYIKNNNIGVPKISLTVSFTPLWQTEEYKDMISIEHVNLCDIVHVEFAQLGVSATARVNKTEFDVLAERYDSIDLGDARGTLTDSFSVPLSDLKKEISNDYTTKSLLQKSVDRASQMITGGLGGHVVLKMNADNQPEEILILADSTDYKTAQKVWRWNKNGLGYSSTGYDGEYRTAITADGHIVADFVDTGSLLANIITAGILQDVKGENYWNLDTGELNLSAKSTVGGTNIKVAVDSINSKVSKGDIISEINQSAEGVKIKGDKIDLEGDVALEGSFRARQTKYGNSILMSDGCLYGYDSNGNRVSRLELSQPIASNETGAIIRYDVRWIIDNELTIQAKSINFDVDEIYGLKDSGLESIRVAGEDSVGTIIALVIDGKEYYIHAN